MSNLEAELEAMDKSLGLEPEAPAEETAPEEEQPRDEAGRFAAKEEETPPEPEAETPADETLTEGEAAERLLAGKYKNADELERAYTELQSRMGEQGSELGELRKTLDQLNEKLDREPEPEPMRLDQQGIDSFDALVEENPYQAAVMALQQDPSGLLYNRALESWYEMNPRQASAFERRVEIAQLRNEFAEQLTEQTTPLQEQANKAGLAQAWVEGRQQFSDLDEHAEQIVQAARENPELAEGLVSGDSDQRGKSLRSLYFMAKGMQSATTQEATAAAAAAQAQASRAAKQDGTVATQTTTVPAETVTEDEEWLRKNFDPYATRYMPQETK